MTWDILGKSSRGERPTQQGDGTTEQEKYRTAFQQCTVLWNSLPEECPAIVPDPPPTSKKSVWDAKLEHGVVCSYYDLFLRCCIKFALANDGAMPTDECFPCESNCDCTDISIGYTTQGMQVNEEQTLTVEGGVDGCVYAWGLVGGGTLSGEEGDSVVYTAPATNPNCESNAVVSLSVGGAQCDSLYISINAETRILPVVRIFTYLSHSDVIEGKPTHNTGECGDHYIMIFNQYYNVSWYDCSGALYSSCGCARQGSGDEFTNDDNDYCYCYPDDMPEAMEIINNVSEFWYQCGLGSSSANEYMAANPYDNRRAAQIESGCCPMQLL